MSLRPDFSSVVLRSVRNEGGQGGLNPPKCARKCANFRNLKANVQILDRKTPPNVSPTGLTHGLSA